MMGSAYYLDLKNKYQNVKQQIQSVLPSFDTCESVIRSASVNLEKIIFDGKSFDDGKLSQDLVKVSGVRENLNSIIQECNNKITEYDNLYQQALSMEIAIRNKKKLTFKEQFLD